MSATQAGKATERIVRLGARSCSQIVFGRAGGRAPPGRQQQRLPQPQQPRAAAAHARQLGRQRPRPTGAIKREAVRVECVELHPQDSDQRAVAQPGDAVLIARALPGRVEVDGQCDGCVVLIGGALVQRAEEDE